MVYFDRYREKIIKYFISALNIMGNRNIILMHGFANKFQDEILPIIENTPIQNQKRRGTNTKIASFNKSLELLIK